MKIFSTPSLDSVIVLLTAAGLPSEDLGQDCPVTFFSIGPNKNPDGVVGFEPYGSNGLLRSLSVTNAAQGKGYGRALVAHAEFEAHKLGITALYLLTETAEHFFGNLHYDVVMRDQVPVSIRSTTQFSALCPDSATVMRKSLQGVKP